MKLPVYIHLSLCDITSEIRNGMCDVIVGHGEDGDLCDGTIPSLYSTSSFIDGGQICVHVTGETTTTWHLLSSSRHLGKYTIAYFHLMS